MITCQLCAYAVSVYGVVGCSTSESLRVCLPSAQQPQNSKLHAAACRRHKLPAWLALPVSLPRLSQQAPEAVWRAAVERATAAAEAAQRETAQLREQAEASLLRCNSLELRARARICCSIGSRYAQLPVVHHAHTRTQTCQT